VNGKVNSPASITSITENTNRDEFILKLIKDCYITDRKILVLSDRKAHCDRLKQLLNGFSVGLYYGGMKKDELNLSNNCKIIIATYQMASEGYDNPDLDTLVLASPKGNVEQAVGRILRKKNKNAALVIDINDSISIFTNWGKKRQAFYKCKNFNFRFINEENVITDELSDLKITECLI
jgi:superfamily II DNA or RNA helicase